MMKKITRHLLAISLVVLTCCVGGYFLFTAQEARAQSHIENLVSSIPNDSDLLESIRSCDLPQDSLTSEIPANPASVTGCTLEPEISDFAWQVFVALNWPADCWDGNPLNDVIGTNPHQPRVWEFYDSPDNIFLEDATEPEPGTRNCDNYISSSLHLSEGAAEDDDDEGLDDKPLVDRWGNYILSEIRINPVEVDQIIKNKWYDANNLSDYTNEFSDEEVDLTTGPFALVCSYSLDPDKFYHCREHNNDDGDVGGIEIKAAWMVLCNEDESEGEMCGEETEIINKDDYYTTTRTFKAQTSPQSWEDVTVPVALVGFHIAYKTVSDGWIWSTFEHKNNVPDEEDDAQLYYNLFKEGYTGCPENTPCATSPYLWRKNEFPHAVTEMETQQIPSQITREFGIFDVATDLNERWHEKLSSSIWQNYILIGTQWLRSPETPLSSSVNPQEHLANVTLEPYIKMEQEQKQSCIGCHTTAALPPNDKEEEVRADFSFLLNNAKSKNP